MEIIAGLLSRAVVEGDWTRRTVWTQTILTERWRNVNLKRNVNRAYFVCLCLFPTVCRPATTLFKYEHKWTATVPQRFHDMGGQSEIVFGVGGAGLKSAFFIIHHLLCQFSHPENRGSISLRNSSIHRAYCTVQTTRDDRHMKDNGRCNLKTDKQLGVA